ncbi:MAG: acyl carrier protein [Gammaproteobacteria bacterium]|nr:acyl carrier protein [Gammaproteobacteria bacterium]
MTASYEEILEKVISELSALTTSDANLTENSELVTELGLDSFKVLDLLMDIEDEFDISMPVNLLADVHTVKDLAERIHAVINTETGI